MNNQDEFLILGKLWAVWNVKHDDEYIQGIEWPRVNYFKCDLIQYDVIWCI